MSYAVKVTYPVEMIGCQSSRFFILRNPDGSLPTLDSRKDARQLIKQLKDQPYEPHRDESDKPRKYSVVRI